MQKNIALLVVDPQVDFFEGGALAVPNASEIIAPLKHVIACNPELPILLTRDWHPKHTVHFAPSGAWPVHCVAGSMGAKFHPALEATVNGRDVRVFSKGQDATDEDSYSGFKATSEGHGLLEHLRAYDIRHLLVGGLATDYCVKATVLDALANGISVTILTKCMRAVVDEVGAIQAMVAAGAVRRL